MKLSIGKAAALCGVSVRTLRYYDSIGLVKPDGLSATGYRWYGEPAISRLQQVLFYRELELSLHEIQSILAHPDYDPSHTLREHRQLLQLRQKRLDELLRLVDNALEGNTMSKPKTTYADIEAAKKQYANEARTRWGSTSAWAESQRREETRTPNEAQNVSAEMDEIFAAFAALRGSDPACESVQALVARWQTHITQHFYPCTKEILAGLGEMYVGDVRFTQNIDRFGPGTAQLMSDSIRVFCTR